MAAIVYWGEDAGGFNFLFFIFSKIGVNNWLGNYFGKVGFGLLAYWEYIEPNFLAPPPQTVSEKIRGTKPSIVHCLGLLIRCETKRPFLWIKSCIQQLLKNCKEKWRWSWRQQKEWQGLNTVLVLMKYKEISIGLLGWSHDLPKHDLWIGSD